MFVLRSFFSFPFLPLFPSFLFFSFSNPSLLPSHQSRPVIDLFLFFTFFLPRLSKPIRGRLKAFSSPFVIITTRTPSSPSFYIIRAENSGLISSTMFQCGLLLSLLFLLFRHYSSLSPATRIFTAYSLLQIFNRISHRASFQIVFQVLSRKGLETQRQHRLVSI